MRAYGVPEQVLTDNAKMFTGRFGSGTGEVLFDRICRENGIRHILTAPRSPTTTGKVERWHKTLRQEFLAGKVFASVEDAQAQVDGWVRHYNFERRHQRIGDVVPWERFRPPQMTLRSPPCTLRPRRRRRRLAGSAARARSASQPSCMRSVCGSRARPWRSQSSSGWSASATAGCWWPPTPSGTGPPRSPRPCTARANSGARGPASPRWARSWPARSTPQGPCPSPAPPTRPATPTGAARSRSPLSATPWRSQPAARCRGCIGSSTTAAESTARSPTPQEGPRAPTRRVTPSRAVT